MSENQKKEKLFQEFPPVSTEAWEEKIHQDLKGKSYEKKLIWNTPEGFHVRPYYRAEDLKNLKHLSYKPGEFPYARGNKPNHNDWNVRQHIRVHTVKDANTKALDILSRGVNALGFHLQEVPVFNRQMLDELLQDICIEAITLHFSGVANPEDFLRIFLEKISQDGIQFGNLKATIDYAPLAKLVQEGNFGDDTEAAAFEKASALIDQSRDYPELKVLEVHGEHYHNAGATLVQELGYALAEGAEYMTAMTERGHRADEAVKALQFNFAVGSVYFMEIAKIRAARLLWAQIANAYKPENQERTKMNVHSVTSDWNKTVYDPYNNMIRTTTEAMSAAIGGAESLTVKPYDTIYRDPSEFSERIARNQQIILKEEAHFDKVADPAGGAYYIENLTASMAQHAWNIFLEIQNAGGFLKAFKTGTIQEKIRESAQKRDMNLAQRKKILLGTNQFPNAKEVMDQDIPESVVQPDEPANNAERVAEPVVPYRGAMKFEQLRLQTDRSNKNPKVFMLKVGHPATRTARSQFAANFFGCAGYEILDNLGFNSVQEGVDEARKQQADIVVLCSSDEEYRTVVPEAYQAMKDQAIVVLAGYPKDQIEDLKAVGIEHFIHLKSNLYDTLKSFQKLLGIEQA